MGRLTSSLMIGSRRPDTESATEQARQDVTLLLRRWGEGAVRLAYYLTRDREVALDLSQEAFVRSLDSLPGMLSDSSGGRVWFNRIVVNLCRDWMRRRGAERRAMAKRPADPQVPDPMQQAEHKETLAQARQALLGLPFEYREALTLVGVERLSPKEAAEALGIPDATLRWRLHQARKLLRETMAEGR